MLNHSTFFQMNALIGTHQIGIEHCPQHRLSEAKAGRIRQSQPACYGAHTFHVSQYHNWNKRRVVADSHDSRQQQDAWHTVGRFCGKSLLFLLCCSQAWVSLTTISLKIVYFLCTSQGRSEGELIGMVLPELQLMV